MTRSNDENAHPPEQFAANGALAASASGVPAWKRRILVVDDEAPARILSTRVFSEAGFHVVSAKSGFECIELIRKQPRGFDLIVLDFSMPFMDGAETFRRLRAINPEVVVLLSTAFMAKVERRIDQMLTTGLNDIILKPHRPDELLAKARALLERVKFSRVGCMANEMASSA